MCTTTPSLWTLGIKPGALCTSGRLAKVIKTLQMFWSISQGHSSCSLVTRAHGQTVSSCCQASASRSDGNSSDTNDGPQPAATLGTFPTQEAGVCLSQWLVLSADGSETIYFMPSVLMPRTQSHYEEGLGPTCSWR